MILILRNDSSHEAMNVSGKSAVNFFLFFFYLSRLPFTCHSLVRLSFGPEIRDGGRGEGAFLGSTTVSQVYTH